MVVEQANCAALLNFDVDEGIALDVLSDVTSVSCYGESDGAIALTVNNGEAPFTFTLLNPETESNGTGVFEAVGGEYNVVVSDSLGCPGVLTVTVPERETLQWTLWSPMRWLRGRGNRIDRRWSVEPFAFVWTSEGELISEDQKPIYPRRTSNTRCR